MLTLNGINVYHLSTYYGLPRAFSVKNINFTSGNNSKLIMPNSKFILENDLLSDFFNQRLLDFLPGTFYLYQMDNGTFKLKVWNKFHKELFHLTDEDCLNTSALDYIDPAYHNIITNAVEKLVNVGFIKQVIANILTPEGKSIPFLFEGYKLEIEGKLYFTGVGLNISELVSLQEQLQILALANDKITTEVAKKERQLLTLALEQNQSNDLLNDITLKLDAIIQNKETAGIENKLKKLSNSLASKIKTKDNWSAFKKLFVNSHTKFFKNLKEQHPDLTESEIRYCSYIKINMSPNDICIALSISKTGLKKKRYRLNKKLALSEGLNIDYYISTQF